MNGSSENDRVGCSVIMSVTEVGTEDCKILGDSTDMDVKIDCSIVGCNEETTVALLLLGIADDSVIGMMIGNKTGVGADGTVLERLIGSIVTIDGNKECGEDDDEDVDGIKVV
jgi:hypothetical protein